MQNRLNDLDEDGLRELCGLNELTIAGLIEYQSHLHVAHNLKEYRVVSFMRINPEEDEPLTYKEVLAEKGRRELMCPENIHRIEKIEESSTNTNH